MRYLRQHFSPVFCSVTRSNFPRTAAKKKCSRTSAVFRRGMKIPDGQRVNHQIAKKQNRLIACEAAHQTPRAGFARWRQYFERSAVDAIPILPTAVINIALPRTRPRLGDDGRSPALRHPLEKSPSVPAAFSRTDARYFRRPLFPPQTHQGGLRDRRPRTCSAPRPVNAATAITAHHKCTQEFRGWMFHEFEVTAFSAPLNAH